MTALTLSASAGCLSTEGGTDLGEPESASVADAKTVEFEDATVRVWQTGDEYRAELFVEDSFEAQLRWAGESYSIDFLDAESLEDEIQGVGEFLDTEMVVTVLHTLWTRRFEENIGEGATVYAGSSSGKTITRRNKRWRNAQTGQCMQRVGANVLMRNCSGAGAQKWNETRFTFYAHGTTFRFFRYSGQGRCMKKNGNNLATKPCGGGDFAFNFRNLRNGAALWSGPQAESGNVRRDFVTTQPIANRNVFFERRNKNKPGNTVIRDRWNFI